MGDIEIIFGSDHAGFELKEKLSTFVTSNKLANAVYDTGCFSKDRVDYPDYAKAVANKLSQSRYTRKFGVLVCGTGIGIGIAANRFDHIRCALCSDNFSAEMSRKHNNANCISIGARRTTFEDACKILKTFLTTEFEGGRHQKRLDKINHLKTMLSE